MIEVLGQDFVRTARAKGLGERAVLWKHAFRNALFPLISLIAMTIPGLLAGSIVVEFIFAVPGMGRLMFNSIFAQDWPFVYTVLLLTALLTMVANLLGDICYALADPRVRF
jgi:peptide/nickel transport system permease protein